MITLLAVACGDPSRPDRQGLAAPAFSHGGAHPRVTGLGAIGAGDAAPGSDRLDLDFEAAVDLTGRLLLRDWAVVRGDGRPATLTVDADPATGVTTFRDGSAVCEDPTHGAEFEGTGRNDLGTLYQFRAAICDNGAAGSGADFFGITIPSIGYTRTGVLSSGDIVKEAGESPPPPGTGTLSITAATTGDEIPTRYTLDFSGPQSGSVSIGANETVSGTVAAGDYTLTLGAVPAHCTVAGLNPRAVTVSSGGTAGTTFTVTCTATTPPPEAIFTFSCSGLTCTFDASSSRAQATATYGWTWDDGTPAGSGKSATHTYGAAGSYQVTLTVTDGGGASSKTQTVTVTQPNQPPSVNVGADQTVLLGLLYTLSASFTDPDGNGPWSYTITWGDGTSSTGARSSQGTFTAAHSYLLIGSYTIRVTVRDNQGASWSDTKVLTVLTPLPGLP